MAESKFNRTMRNKLEQWGFEFFRVESHGTSPGIPDDHWLHAPSGVSGWLEIKQVTTIKTPSKVPYRPNQPAWLQSYNRKGGRAATIVHLPYSDRVIFVPGRESLAAAVDLRKALGAQTILLTGEEGWKRLANLILAP